MPTPRIPIPMPEIAAFCQKWKITEFSLFGSVLRDDFGPESDVDVLVTFGNEAEWGLLEFGRMESELQALFGREVDIIQRKAVERSRNYIRRHGILSNTHAIFQS